MYLSKYDSLAFYEMYVLVKNIVLIVLLSLLMLYLILGKYLLQFSPLMVLFSFYILL